MEVRRDRRKCYEVKEKIKGERMTKEKMGVVRKENKYAEGNADTK
jgi:hypothetical protein